MPNPLEDLFERAIPGYTSEQLAAAMNSKVSNNTSSGAAAKLSGAAQTAGERKKEFNDLIGKFMDAFSKTSEIKDIHKYLEDVRDVLKDTKKKQDSSKSKNSFRDLASLEKKISQNANHSKKQTDLMQTLVRAATTGHSLHVEDFHATRVLQSILTAIRQLNSKSGRTAPNNLPEISSTRGAESLDARRAEAAGARGAEVGGRSSKSASNVENAVNRAGGSFKRNFSYISRSLIYHNRALGITKDQVTLITDAMKNRLKVSGKEMANISETVQNYKQLSIIDQIRLQRAGQRLAYAIEEGKNVDKNYKNLAKLSESLAGQSSPIWPMLSNTVSGLGKMASTLAALPKFSWFEIAAKGLNEGAQYTKEMSAALYESYGLIGDVTDAAHAQTTPVGRLQVMYHEIGDNIKQAYLETGQLSDVFRKQYLRNVGRGIGDQTKANKLTKAGLATAKLIGANAENTADEFADWFQHINLSTGQMNVFGRNIQHVQRMTGLAGDRLLDVVKTTKELARQMQFTGNYTDEVGRHLMQIGAAGKKYGVEEMVGKLQRGLSSSVGFNKSDDQTRTLLAMAAARGGVLPQLQLGQVMKNAETRKQFAAGLKSVVENFIGAPIEDLDKLDPTRRAMMELSFAEAFGTSLGEAQQTIKAFEDGLLTATDKIAKLQKELATTTVTEKRRQEIDGQIMGLKLEERREAATKELENINKTSQYLRSLAPGTTNRSGLASDEYKRLTGGGNLKESLGKQLGTAEAMSNDQKAFLNKEYATFQDSIKSQIEKLPKEVQDAFASTKSTSILPPAIQGMLEKSKKMMDMITDFDNQQSKIDSLRKSLESGTPEDMLHVMDEIGTIMQSSDIQDKLKNLDVFTKAEHLQNIMVQNIQENVEKIAKAIAGKIGAGGLFGLNFVSGTVEDLVKVLQTILPILTGIKDALIGGVGGLGNLGGLGGLGGLAGLFKGRVVAGGGGIAGLLLGPTVEENLGKEARILTDSLSMAAVGWSMFGPKGALIGALIAATAHVIRGLQANAAASAASTAALSNANKSATEMNNALAAVPAKTLGDMSKENIESWKKNVEKKKTDLAATMKHFKEEEAKVGFFDKLNTPGYDKQVQMTNFGFDMAKRNLLLQEKMIEAAEKMKNIPLDATERRAAIKANALAETFGDNKAAMRVLNASSDEQRKKAYDESMAEFGKKEERVKAYGSDVYGESKDVALAKIDQQRKELEVSFKEMTTPTADIADSTKAMLDAMTKKGSIYVHDVHVQEALKYGLPGIDASLAGSYENMGSSAAIAAAGGAALIRKQQQSELADTQSAEAMAGTQETMSKMEANTAESNMRLTEMIDILRKLLSAVQEPGAADTSSNVKSKTPANYWSMSPPAITGSPLAGATSNIYT